MSVSKLWIMETEVKKMGGGHGRSAEIHRIMHGDITSGENWKCPIILEIARNHGVTSDSYRTINHILIIFSSAIPSGPRKKGLSLEDLPP